MPQDAASKLDAGRRPRLLVGIDTEADDQWSDAARRDLRVLNAKRLPALQALFDRHGVRPAYLVTHEMATREPAVSILRELAATGRCEIGTHLHPWSSPPFREEDLKAHTYPHNLPPDLLERQLTELTETIAARIGVRPRTYRAGRNGFDGRTLPILERLGYTVDTSVDPLFNERRKRGMCFGGAPVHPYFPDPLDVRRAGESHVLEVPISSATLPRLPKFVEGLYTRLPPLRFRNALRRLGLRPVWLRPSYARLKDMRRLADHLAAQDDAVLNVGFHSSEVLPGGSPYTPDAESVTRFLEVLEHLLAHLIDTLAARPLTFAELAAERARVS
jgi:hypothetical protein